MEWERKNGENSGKQWKNGEKGIKTQRKGDCVQQALEREGAGTLATPLPCKEPCSCLCPRPGGGTDPQLPLARMLSLFPSQWLGWGLNSHMSPLGVQGKYSLGHDRCEESRFREQSRWSCEFTFPACGVEYTSSVNLGRSLPTALQSGSVSYSH